MGRALEQYVGGRDNNFNLIRFIAACLVLISHSFPLSIGSGAAEPLSSMIGMTLGAIAVDIFFVTSGFLITSSVLSRKNIVAFVWARVLRIYPALVVAVLFCVFGVGLFFSTLSSAEYLLNLQTLKYLVKNTILIFGVNHTLPGVFIDVPYKEAVNGSLWTLPYEVWMYALLVVILGFANFFARKIRMFYAKDIVFLVAIISVIGNLLNNFYFFMPVVFTHLFSMFFVGSAFFFWRDKVFLSAKAMFFSLFFLVISSLSEDTFFVSYCVLLPYLIFCFAYIPSGFIRKFNEFGDYSYGIYIYAFPVQQSIAAIALSVSVWEMIVLSFLFTFILAGISWHLIEDRFLRMKGSYVYIEKIINSNR